MKNSVIRLLSLIIAVTPMMAVAQSNIRSAFDAIIKCPQAQISESHTLNKNPSTGEKTGQSDVYNFVLPANKINLVNNVVKAFDKDAEMAYSYNRGNVANEENDIKLSQGDENEKGINITELGGEYIYSLFLAPISEDSNGIYRYAYGMNYKEEGGEVVGKLVVTYATTLKYRQQKALEGQNFIFRELSNGGAYSYTLNSPQQSWFDMLMSYFQSMTQANSQTRIALASKAYKVIRDTPSYPEVTDADKEAVREILKGMIADKKYSETVLNKLLVQCLSGLK